MAVSAQKASQLIHWLKLRRLAFRFDGKVKVICCAGFIVPGIPAIDHPHLVYVSALIGLVMLAFIPVWIGKGVAREIQSRFGSEVLDRAMYHCTFGRYMRNKTFTIGQIQNQLDEERLDRESRAQNDD